MPRLFFGLELPDFVRNYLFAEGKRWQESGKMHREDMLHLTLCFLGNVEAGRIGELKEMMADKGDTPFRLTLSNLGTFKDGTILWAGVQAEEHLFSLRAGLAEDLIAAGYPVEREYTPHITLGRGMRIKGETLPPIQPIRFPVRSFALFESARVDGILRYTPICRHTLEGEICRI